MKRLDILAIEYNRQDAEVIKYMLNKAGRDLFPLSLSHGFAGGLALLRKKIFDVVLLDLESGGRGAGDSVQYLIREFPQVPVIVLARAASEDRAIQALKAGARDYLIKERLTPELLVRAIRWAVERNRLSSQNDGLRSELERLEREIGQMPRHDELTGLPNVRLLIDRLVTELDRADRLARKVAVLALMLDGFQETRRSFGDDTGRILVTKAASRLRSLLRKSDTVARIGEDVFCAVLPDIVQPVRVAEIAQEIGEAFRSPFSGQHHELHSTVSIGIGIYPDDGRDAETILKHAENALLLSVGSGNGRYRFFDASLTALASERERLKDLLRGSIGSGGLIIYYQPLVDISSGKIVCAEALARWRHPERGILPPDEFIPVAEEAGLTGVIDEWALHESLGQAQSWRDAGLNPACVTINVSGRRLHDPGLVQAVRTALQETGLPADSLCLEIAERTVMSDIDRTGERLRDLADLGVRISIDDFGTGYSSLNHLERLPLQRLKIDRSFISRIPADPDHRMIVRSLTSLAHNMRIKVVAVGVETEDQLRFVRATGCDEMQGYFFSRPLPAPEFADLLGKR